MEASRYCRNPGRKAGDFCSPRLGLDEFSKFRRDGGSIIGDEGEASINLGMRHINCTTKGRIVLMLIEEVEKFLGFGSSTNDGCDGSRITLDRLIASHLFDIVPVGEKPIECLGISIWITQEINEEIEMVLRADDSWLFKQIEHSFKMSRFANLASENIEQVGFKLRIRSVAIACKVMIKDGVLVSTKFGDENRAT